MAFHLFTSITQDGGFQPIFLLKDIAGPLVALVVGAASVWIASSNNRSTLAANRQAIEQSERNVSLQAKLEREEQARNQFRNLAADFLTAHKRQRSHKDNLQRVEKSLKFTANRLDVGREAGLKELNDEGSKLAGQIQTQEHEKLRISQVIDLLLEDSEAKTVFKDAMKPYFSESELTAQQMLKDGRKFNEAAHTVIKSMDCLNKSSK